MRVFHWTLVTAFAIAYLTEDDLLTVHVWAGYVVSVLIVARLLWGFVGPRHARFSDFVYAPATTLRYMRDLILFRAERHLGHSPGGGAMVVLLLALLTLTVATGLVVYGGDQQAGPLAGMFTRDTGVLMARAARTQQPKNKSRTGNRNSPIAKPNKGSCQTKSSNCNSARK